MKRFTAIALASMLAFAAPAQAKYEKDYIGETKTYTAKYEDTFVHLARDFNLGYVEMRAANQQFDPWIPGAGAKLVIPTMHILPDAPHTGIVINIADMRLYAFVNGDDEPSSYALGVGREGLETPQGTTTVIRKVHGPVWTPTPRMRREKPELPAQVAAFAFDNPMGTHALYLGFPQIAIHGTDKPYGIGRRVSSGCLRLYPEGIADLYDKIPVGTKVTVVNQPIKLAWIGDELYLEAQPDINQAIQMEETGSISSQTMTDEDMQRILKIAGEYQDRLHWSVIRTAVRERKGVPIVIARRPSANGAMGPEQPESLRGETAIEEEAEPDSVKEAAAIIVETEAEVEEKTQAAKRTLNP